MKKVKNDISELRSKNLDFTIDFTEEDNCCDYNNILTESQIRYIENMISQNKSIFLNLKRNEVCMENKEFIEYSEIDNLSDDIKLSVIVKYLKNITNKNDLLKVKDEIDALNTLLQNDFYEKQFYFTNLNFPNVKNNKGDYFKFFKIREGCIDLNHHFHVTRKRKNKTN